MKMLNSMAFIGLQERQAGDPTHLPIMEVHDVLIIQALGKYRVDPVLIRLISYFGYGVISSIVALLTYLCRKVKFQEDDF